MQAGRSDPQASVFRPRLDAWLGRVILPAAFLVVLGVTALNLPGLTWLLLAVLPTIGLVGGAYAIPILLGRIAISRAGFWANVDGMRLSLQWKEVRALRIAPQDGEPYLIIGVGAGLYVVPVHHFDEKAVWEAIRQAAPADAMRPDAFDYIERKDSSEGIPPDLWLVGSLHVIDNRGLTIAAGLGVAGFLLLFVIALVAHLPGAPVYLAFAALYLLAFLSIGTTELDLRGLTRRTPLGVMRIRWDDLNDVVIGPFGLRIALQGMRRKRIVLFGPPLWTGPDAARAVHFLALQISTRRLPRRRSLLALFQASRDTRMGGDA